MTPLQEEALYSILAPHWGKLRFSIKWRFDYAPGSRFTGRSEARIIGAPRVKPLVVGEWRWEASRRPKDPNYAGYCSCPLKGLSISKLALVSEEFKSLVTRLYETRNTAV